MPLTPPLDIARRRRTVLVPGRTLTARDALCILIACRTPLTELRGEFARVLTVGRATQVAESERPASFSQGYFITTVTTCPVSWVVPASSISLAGEERESLIVQATHGYPDGDEVIEQMVMPMLDGDVLAALALVLSHDLLSSRAWRFTPPASSQESDSWVLTRIRARLPAGWSARHDPSPDQLFPRGDFVVTDDDGHEDRCHGIDDIEAVIRAVRAAHNRGDTPVPAHVGEPACEHGQIDTRGVCYGCGKYFRSFDVTA